MALPVSDQHLQITNEIYHHRRQLAEYVTAHSINVPYWNIRYGEQGRMTCLNDNVKNIELFTLALRKAKPEIADAHALWLRDVYINLGMCTEFAVQSFAEMQRGATNLLSHEAASALNGLLERVKATLIYTDPLCQELRAHEDAITEIVVNAMYAATPFWQVRYGDAGRAACATDTRYNIAYIIDAAGRQNAQGLVIHTQWMRKFLIERGMCTAYYAQALTLLADAIVANISSQHHAQIRSINDALQAGLRHDHPFAQLIESQQATITRTVTAQHYDRAVALQQRMTRHEYANDLLYKLSFLVDAVVTGQPQIMSSHLQWVRSVLPQLNLTPADLDAELHTLAAALPTGTPDQARALLQ
ncbi:MAG: hypothetical protein GYB67_12100 [Chloroflexi bacterium]|nr:hypothetical protein [Chloroflexota bacterium]